MTKLKNTKKGMAKKALSISLVAAMLATSNVPVWAAEFTDGTDAVVEAPVVEEFTAEAPVEEETVATPLSSTVTESDVKVSLEVDNKSVIWGKTATLKGSVTKADGSSLGSWKYRWVDENGDVVQNKDGQNKSGTATSVGNMNLATDEAMAGKTVSLRVYNDATDAQYDIDTGIKVTVEKKALTKLTLGAAVQELAYNGFSQSVDTSKVTFSIFANNEGSPATVPVGKTYWTATADSAKTVGEKVTLTVTAEADSPYIGTVSETVAKIKKRSHVSGDIIADTEKGQSYQYTGNDVVIDKAKVSLKESERTDSNKNGLSGADLSNAITDARIKKEQIGRIGDYNVTVKFDNDKLDNIDASKVTTGFTTKETVKITKRDLSTASTSIGIVNGTIKVGTSVNDFKSKLLVFSDANSKEVLNLGSNYSISVVNADDVTVNDFNKAGTYTVTVKGNGTLTENEQTFTVDAAAAVLTGMEWSKSNSYRPSYTGNEIKPVAEDLGELTVNYIAENGDPKAEKLGSDAWKIVGYTNNTNAATYVSGTAMNNATDIYDVANTKTRAYVNVEITKGSFAGTTYAIPFVIAPLKVNLADITVQDKVNFDKDIVKAEEYALPVSVLAKDFTGKQVVKTLDAKDFTVKYEYQNTTNNNKIGNNILTSVKVTNPNYIWGTEDGKTFTIGKKTTNIVARQLTDAMVQVNPSSYTYTGGKIEPTYAVVDGALVLYKKGDVASGKEEYEEVRITDALNVGTGTIVVKGLNSYSGEAKGTFTITPADTKDVKVEIDDQDYTGRQVRPRDFKVTLNGNDVTDQFEIVSYGTNVEAGKGTVVLKPVKSTKNFTGANVTAEFNIVKEKITATLSVKDDKGFDITADWTVADESKFNTSAPKKSFNFDGTAKTFAKAVVSDLKKSDNKKTTATVDDIEIKYVDNVSGKKTNVNGKNIAYVYAVAKEGTGFAGADTITTADGTVIKGVVAKKAFAIDSVKFVKENVTVKNATYAAGLPVKPEVLVQIGGNTLVEGKDYTVKLVDSSKKEVVPTDVTVSNIYSVIVTGINGYEGSNVDGVTEKITWGVDKKDLSDCNVTAKDGVVTVLNGYIPVPTTEYTVKENDDKTYTVTANKESKNYTGSKTVVAEGQKPAEGPEAPVITDVKVVGNKATVVLSGECEGATGYDYVISTENDYKNGRLPNGINKNQLATKTSYQYLDQGIYYAYCHAWKKVDGKKVFSGWSNIYPFAVTSITPSKPVITSVKVSKNTVKVTYTKSANATGYDIVLGKSMKKVNGEMRPVEYGKLVKKVYKGNTVTATFTKVGKGTYYAGLHAYNRTSEDGKKVFSPWSNAKKVVVK